MCAPISVLPSAICYISLHNMTTNIYSGPGKFKESVRFLLQRRRAGGLSQANEERK